MITIFETANPSDIIDRQLDQFFCSLEQSTVFAVSYPFLQYYFSGSPEIRLLALVVFSRLEKNDVEKGNHSQSISATSAIKISVTIVDGNQTSPDGLISVSPTLESVQLFCSKNQLPLFVFNQPVLLQPIDIPKPWGKEVWYTGIEERGQSLATDGSFSIPLPWLLSLGEKYWLDQSHNSLLLLKILDPLPEPVFGDLYFEMHEEKREVYVVTHVDENAWPSGEGGIRFGFDQSQRHLMANDKLFKQEYLRAVKNYQEIRINIDQSLDECRKKENVGMNEPVSAETTQRWLATIDDDCQEKELELRTKMESFIHVQTLRVGDVIKVPTHTPHSLMHGVRTIEFQTPVYERKILSFAQKVLTQNHWDTESAMDIVSLEAPVLPTLNVIDEFNEQFPAATVEEVVRFDDFEVIRITLENDGAIHLPLDQKYGLVIMVQGRAVVNQLELVPEQSVLLGGQIETAQIECISGPAILLLASPF